MNFPKIFNVILVLIALVAAGILLRATYTWLQTEKTLRQMADRLTADSRIAEVLVTKSEYDEATQKIHTTIKFLEYDSRNQPLAPRYFTFQGNVIQFQSLVVRFDDKFVKMGERLRGKSVYLFMKAFVLDGEKTQSFDITMPEHVPEGYRIPDANTEFEQMIWKQFWTLVLDPKLREKFGVKNAQIEAPGSIFVPGSIYTLKIEHDGGIRIDSAPVPPILKGEKL